MELSYTHLCYNDEEKRGSSIEKFKLLKGTSQDEYVSETRMIFVVEGEVGLTYENQPEMIISRGGIILVFTGSHCSFRILEDVDLVVFTIDFKQLLCNYFSIDELLKCKKETRYSFDKMEMNELLWRYIHNTISYLDDELCSSFLFEVKVQELFCLFRISYSIEEITTFFYSEITSNTSFSEIVLKNYQNVKTVQEFAALSNCSLSSFEKQFKKVFGVPAYKWMTEQRASRIFRELKTNIKPLKEISDEYGFSSSSQFSDFCKTHFGRPPGKIRHCFSTEMAG